jgi:hypothetical protein
MNWPSISSMMGKQAKAIDQMVKPNPSIIPDQAGLKE